MTNKVSNIHYPSLFLSKFSVNVLYLFFIFFGEFEKFNLKFEKINKRNMLVLFLATTIRVGKLSIWAGFFQAQT